MNKPGGYLYVDDDAFSRDAMRMIVQNQMHEPLTIFENSANFMQKLYALEYMPRIIMLDIHMKPHTGFELLTMIRADLQYCKVLVIALTASVMNEEMDQLREVGFDSAIAKPFSIRTLPDFLSRIASGEKIWWSH